MERIFNKNHNIVIAILVLVTMFAMSISSFASNALYTDGLAKGDKLKFTASSWTVYGTKAAAKKANGNEKRYLKNGEIITVVSIATDCNVIKIANGEFIHYGKNASNYFKKVESATKVSNIKLNKTSETLAIGDTVKITQTIEPQNASNKAVTFKSNKTSVATVDDDGNVKAIAPGSATITVTAKDGSNKKATCKITVSKPVEISFKESAKGIEEGQKLNLKSELIIKNTNNKNVIFTSSNGNIVAVNKTTGEVTTKGLGTTFITATSEADRTKSATCKITVMSASVKVSSISLNKKTATMYIGDTLTLTATINVTPNKAANKKVQWESDNPGVASVNGKGEIKANSIGTANIKAIALSDTNKTATCKITVGAPKVKKVTISGEKKTLTREESIKLSATVIPSNAIQDVTWTSSNKNVTVDQNGVVKVGAKAKNKETAVIKAISKSDKTKEAKWTITVVVKVTAVNIKGSETVKVGNTVKLAATAIPTDANNTKLTWNSSNTKVATVDKNGKVKGISQGTARITVTAKDGSGKYGECIITVQPKHIEPSGIYTGQSAKNKMWGYRSAVKNTRSEQYKLLNGIGKYEGRVTIDYATNIVKVDGYYCSALGTYFGNVGDKFTVTLENGNTIKVIMCDAKGPDAQYKINGKTYAHAYGNTKSFLEFYCAGKPKTMPNSYQYVYQEQFAGRVVSIVKE